LTTVLGVVSFFFEDAVLASDDDDEDDDDGSEADEMDSAIGLSFSFFVPDALL
jgi:hypothetical protein